MRRISHRLLVLIMAAAAVVLLFAACAGQEAASQIETKSGSDGEAVGLDGSKPEDDGKAPAPKDAAEARGADSEREEGSGEVSKVEDTADGSAGRAEGSVERDEGTDSPGEPGPGSPGPRAASGTESHESSAPRLSRTSSSGLEAGFADDNRQFNYYLSFLERYGDVEHRPIPVRERLIVRAVDREGRSLPGARVRIYAGSTLLEQGRTLADGTYLFFPLEYDRRGRADEAAGVSEYIVRVEFDQAERQSTVRRDGPRTVTFTFDRLRPGYTRVPLDILFVLDTTGSMGEEIERLKATIEIINLNLVSLSSRPRVRFGMVLYKDRGDEEYVTRVVPLTGDLEQFRRELDSVYASGGGDTPEDLESALERTVRGVDWNRDGIRLGFVITDAPPHLSAYRQTYTYADAARDAKARAVKLFSVGTGGLDLMGEYVLRQIAQYTSGKYIFLTYGETGESEGGAPGSVSHHTGANYTTDRLEAIIIRFAREELSHLTDQPLDEGEDYFQAVKVESEGREETLRKLFVQALSQLADYSGYRLGDAVPTAALPFESADPELSLNAEYFHDRLVQSMAASPVFRGVERKDIQRILDELELGLSDLADATAAPRIGRMLGAELLIAGRLYGREDAYELFLRLLRVETGEVLSASIARIDRKLGL